MESNLQKKIEGLTHQIELLADKRNTIIRVNRAAKTALDVFSDILRKEKLDRGNLDLLIEKIKVFEDHLEIRLKPDIDTIIRANQLENTVNFSGDMQGLLGTRLVQRSAKGKNKVLHVHVICDGDPLEIYTSGDGEVVFRKYSPIGELSGYAGRYADVLYRMAGLPVVVCATGTRWSRPPGCRKRTTSPAGSPPSWSSWSSPAAAISRDSPTSPRFAPAEGVEQGPARSSRSSPTATSPAASFSWGTSRSPRCRPSWFRRPPPSSANRWKSDPKPPLGAASRRGLICARQKSLKFL